MMSNNNITIDELIRLHKNKLSLEKPVEEGIPVNDNYLFLYLLPNRRQKLLRIIDFRTGFGDRKKALIEEMIAKEGYHKVFLIVEKEEIPAWERLEFVVEGIIPGYYKRSDGYFISKLFKRGVKLIPFDQRPQEQFGDFIKEREVDCKEKPSVKIKYTILKSHEEVLNFLESYYSYETFLSDLLPFGRNSQWLYLQATFKRKNIGNILVVEYQDCFGNAKIDIMMEPKDDEMFQLTLCSLKTLLSILIEKKIVSAFAIVREDLATIHRLFHQAGFSVTGYLTEQIKLDKEYKDAYLWTKKLINLTSEP